METLNIDVECLCCEGVCDTCETVILEGKAENILINTLVI
ncbi:MAG: 2Fe-2S iron-sulfur cluster-binding protein [Acinetobacter calcoaceticus]